MLRGLLSAYSRQNWCEKLGVVGLLGFRLKEILFDRLYMSVSFRAAGVSLRKPSTSQRGGAILELAMVLGLGVAVIIPTLFSLVPKFMGTNEKERTSLGYSSTADRGFGLGELSMEAFETVKPFAAKGAVASLAAFRLEQLTNLTGFCAVTLKAEVDANGAIVAAAVDDTFVASNSGAGAPCDLGSDPLPPDVIPDFMSSLDRRKPGTQIGFTVFRKGQFLRMRSETDTANFGLAN